MICPGCSYDVHPAISLQTDGKMLSRCPNCETPLVAPPRVFSGGRAVPEAEQQHAAARKFAKLEEEELRKRVEANLIEVQKAQLERARAAELEARRAEREGKQERPVPPPSNFPGTVPPYGGDPEQFLRERLYEIELVQQRLRREARKIQAMLAAAAQSDEEEES